MVLEVTVYLWEEAVVSMVPSVECDSEAGVSLDWSYVVETDCCWV